MTGSAGQRRVPVAFFQQLQVPLPPLDEQRRIAAILDQADAQRAKRRQVLDHLDALPQSLFHAMFGAPDDAAEKVPLAELAELSGGRSLVADDGLTDSPYRVLKISAVTAGQFKAAESKPLPRDYVPPPSHLVRSGDLLMSRANTTELVGAVALVHSAPTNVALPDKIWRFEWLDPRSEPAFYQALLSSPSVRRRISQLSSGTGGSMKNVSKAKLMKLELPLVGPEDQGAFARRVAQVKDQHHAAQRALAADDELFASLQSRAFRGEL